MKCSHCGNDGAERMDVQFRNSSEIVMYLCRGCVEVFDADADVDALVSSVED